MSHRVDCPGSDVRVTSGITKSLLHCRGCGVETYVKRALP